MSTTVITQEKMMQAIKAEINRVIANIIEQEAKEAAEKVYNRVHAQADTLALRLLSDYNVVMHRGELMIHVVKEKNND